MKVLVETDAEEILRDVTADSRGRITLGSDYAGETVSIAIVDHSPNSANSDSTGTGGDCDD